MKLIISFVCGFIFSLGLSVAQMVDPNRVIGFLDILGPWDPTLLFVLLGAVVFNLLTYPLILRRDKPLLDSGFDLPKKKVIDLPLILGSILFGCGWGLTGLCPGPALANLFLLQDEVLIFTLAMLLGMSFHKYTKQFFN